MRYTLFLLLFLSFSFLGDAQTSSRAEAIRFLQDGERFLQRGQLTEALDQFTNAIQADYSYANAFLKRAMIYQMQG